MQNWPNRLLNNAPIRLSCATAATITLLPQCQSTTDWKSGGRIRWKDYVQRHPLSSGANPNTAR